MLPSELTFGSHLSYTPRPVDDAGRKAQSVTYALKNNQALGNPPVPCGEIVAARIAGRLRDLPYAGVFGKSVLAIPMPKSSLTKPGTLWVPLELCHALKKFGLVGEVLASVTRSQAVNKSSTSKAADRPLAETHYKSVTVAPSLGRPRSILLVDDVVTRGATFLGIAGRVMEAFPDIPVTAFAFVRTISDPSEFKNLEDPCTGKITLKQGQSFRRP